MSDDGDQTYEDRVTEGYCQLWGEYKRLMVGEHFTMDSLNSHGNLFEWNTESGFKGSIEEPLTNFMDQQIVTAEVMDPVDDEEEEDG